MESRKDVYSKLLKGDQSEDIIFNNYIKDEKKSGRWGGEIEIRACCELYGRDIEIWDYDDKNNKARIIKTFHSNRNKDKNPIKLSYFSGCSYSSIEYDGFEKYFLYKVSSVNEDGINVVEDPGVYEDVIIENRSINNEVEIIIPKNIKSEKENDETRFGASVNYLIHNPRSVSSSGDKDNRLSIIINYYLF